MSTPIVIDVPERQSLEVHLGKTTLTMWPLKEHIFREKVRSIPQLKAFLPENGGGDLSKPGALDKIGDKETSSITFMWSIIQSSIDNTDDYRDLRKRIYGTPHNPDALDTSDHLYLRDIDELPPPQEPLGIVHALNLAMAVMQNLHPEWMKKGTESQETDMSTPAKKATPAKK